MARLPQPGSDNGTWGAILNDYLLQTLKTDGTLKDNSVTASAVAPNSITNAAIATDAINAASIADGSITNTLLANSTIEAAKLSSAIQAKLSTAVGGSVNGTPTPLTLWTGTQSQYDALISPDSATIYVVTPG